jgi:hypothetical protein
VGVVKSPGMSTEEGLSSFSKTKSTVGSFLNSIMFSLLQDPFLFPEKQSGEYYM